MVRVAVSGGAIGFAVCWHAYGYRGRSVMLRTLRAASLALLLVVQSSGRGAEQAPDQPAKPLTLTQVWTLNRTYTDPQHGVTFRYPSVWQATTQFAYHPPALTQSDEAKPIAGFGYSEGGFPRTRIVGPYAGTNLEGVGVVYSAVPAANATECEAKAATLSNSPKRPPVVFGGRSFSVYETGEGGMSQSISGNLYATYADQTCYLIETDLAAALPGVLNDIRALTPAQLRFIDIQLLNIMKSVRIVPTKR